MTVQRAGVLGVGAVDKSDMLTGFSSRGVCHPLPLPPFHAEQSRNAASFFNRETLNPEPSSLSSKPLTLTLNPKP